jgi:anthranilate synthase component 2
MPEVIEAGRYHSWAVKAGNLPGCFNITATGEEEVVMGIQHKQYPLAGVQFHPESILTPDGYTMMKNWINQV